jgi:hypothetical protein
MLVYFIFLNVLLKYTFVEYNLQASHRRRDRNYWTSNLILYKVYRQVYDLSLYQI